MILYGLDSLPYAAFVFDLNFRWFLLHHHQHHHHHHHYYHHYYHHHHYHHHNHHHYHHHAMPAYCVCAGEQVNKSVTTWLLPVPGLPCNTHIKGVPS
jgi:hypothetical protein